jgi:thioredoxin reductase (NADPH)
VKGRELPVLMAVDGDEAELGRLAADLERRFGRDYRIVAEPESRTALAQLARLHRDGRRVALVVAAEECGGIELLARVHEHHPWAKRALLANRRFASGTAISRALTLGRLDYHISKPWMAERTLYPAVSEFLADWSRSPGAPQEWLALRMAADWSVPSARLLREALSRTGMPLRLYDAASEEGLALQREAGVEPTGAPIALFTGGPVLVDPSFPEFAQALGARTEPEHERYDVAILGGGPAGLAAAVYAASEGLHTVVLEPLIHGGQAASSSRIRNYLGFPRGIRGDDLGYRAIEQAWLFDAEVLFAQGAERIERAGERIRVHITHGSPISARAVVIAVGVAWRRLGVPGVEERVGAGVFYGAGRLEIEAMDGAEVVLVGAGNSAGQAAVALSRYAASVTVLTRRASLTESMSAYLAEQIAALPTVLVRTEAEVSGAQGDGRLAAVEVRHRRTGETSHVPAAALFVMVGAEPRTGWLSGAVALDEAGFVLTGPDLRADGRWPLEREPALFETSMPGVFAVGDVRSGSTKRVAAAVGEGATVVQLVHRHLG